MKILEEEQEKPPKGFKIEKYVNTMFRMYDSDRQMVEPVYCEEYEDRHEALSRKMNRTLQETTS